ncbi:gp53-like domain-containing protein [Escherichia coli]|uniref:gp53-like domain-containing protein n=1 Tax=Escherichia coli TaxID=562 RepID=UPI003F4F2BA9
MHEDTHTAIRLVTLDSVRRVTTTTYTINYYANGLIQILGMTPPVSSLTPQTMTFPVAFPNACVRFALHNQESGVPSYNMAMYSNLSRTGVKIWGVANILGNGGSPTLGALPNAEISYEAWGY